MYRCGMFVKWIIVIGLLHFLNGCGGGGNNSDSQQDDPATSFYRVGGTVAGLEGEGLVLQNNGGDDLSITADGEFSFSTTQQDGSSYLVSILSQPENQNCVIDSASGTIAAAEVTDITITCTTNRYTVGGTVSGLRDEALVLQNNGGDDLAITQDGGFAFTTPLESGSAYLVTIATQPDSHQCVVVNGSGTLSRSAVSDVHISCPPDAVNTPSVAVAGSKLLRFNWDDVGADHYRLLKNPDGVSGYSQVGENLSGTRVDEQIPLHLTDWESVSYMVQSCSAAGECADSTPVGINALMLDMIGYLKAPVIRGGDKFASIIALSGDGSTLAVGFPSDDSSVSGVHDDPEVAELPGSYPAEDSGAVYLYIRDDDGWSLQAYIKAKYPESGDSFGRSVALSYDGNRLAVGATGEDSGSTEIDGDQSDNSSIGSGAVFIFSREGARWSQQTFIKASETPLGLALGWQVSLSASGERLAVCGSTIYLFAEGSQGWFEEARLLPEDSEIGDGLGEDLKFSADGMTLAVSAPYEDSSTAGIDGDSANNNATNVGAVYIFSFNENIWTQQAYIKPPFPDNDDYFGTALGISADGNTLAVAAEGEDSSAVGIDGDPESNDSEGSGAVYLFQRESGEWTQSAYLKASNADPWDGFGTDLALSADGDVVAVGAAHEQSLARGVNGDQSNNAAAEYPYAGPGAVYLFRRERNSWTQQAYVKASNPDVGWDPPCFHVCPYVNDEFGKTLDLSSDGRTLVVGAPNENSGDRTNQQDDSAAEAGAIYLY